ncbi:uncharacterized protein O3C94_021004 [Discoglossus pictus]
MTKDKRNMEKVAERFLHQALEMIYLLTGEEYTIVKKNSPNIHQLTGKVPIKCDDVAVYFSMEEWEYIEGHKELYKDVMMENHQTFRASGIPTNKSSVLSLPTYELMSRQMKEESQTPSSSQDTKVDDQSVQEQSSEIIPRKESAFCHKVNTDVYSESYQDKQETCAQSKNFICRTRRARKDTSNCAKLHTRIEDEKASYGRRKSHLARHRSAHTDQKPFVCQQCGKDFSLMPGHDKTHTDKKPHVCQECDLVVTAESDVIAQSVAHTRQKSHTGPDCGEDFCRPSQLIEHHLTHTGEKPFVCQECGKGFSRKTHLAVHNRTHTGEKPFVCNECGKGFSHKQGLKPYVCQECGKGFSQKTYLAVHNRTHTGEKPYTCSQGDKAFSKKFAMLEHQRVHTGEKACILQKYEKNFLHKSNLVTHNRIHTAEKQFFCQECGNGFSSRSYFIKHQRTHT